MQIRQICRQDLEALALSGKLVQGTRLQHVMTALNNMTQADTQSIESANSIVRIISTRCRKISLELLSSRLLIKYALGAYSNLSKQSDQAIQQSASGPKTVNQVRQKIEKGESLHATMIPFAQAFQHDTSVERWAPPPLQDFGVTQKQVILAHPFLRIKSSDEWASSYATALRQTLCPRKKKQHDDDAGQAGKISKAAGASASASSSASVKVAHGQSHSGPSGDVSEIGWPIVKMALESEGLPDETTGATTIATSSFASSSRWFLWIGNYRYTMSFIELYTDYDTKSGSTHFVCKLDQAAVDAATIFASYYGDIQRGASLRVEKLMLQPDSICVQSVAIGSCESGLKLAMLPQGNHETALTRLFTATTTPHVCCQQVFTAKKTAEKAIQGTTKRKKTNHDHHDRDDDDSKDLATRAAEELHGDIDDCPPDFSDEDYENEEAHQHKEDTDVVTSNNVSKIKHAVNNGSCPPAKAIKQVSDIISKWPQFSDLTPEDREEQALIMMITGVSKKDDEVSTVDVTSHQDDETTTGVRVCDDDDKQDDDLPSALVFKEHQATKSMGPASLPHGKDYCKRKGIYLSSAASSSYTEWHQSVLLTAEAFQFQYKHGKDAVSENISLVLMPSRGGDDRAAQLVWVHWLKHQSGSVRQVALDAMGRVIFSLAWAYPALKLQGSDAVANTIILPDAGVPMMKVRSQERPLVPDHVRRLHDVLKSMLHIGSNQDSDFDSLCC